MPARLRFIEEPPTSQKANVGNACEWDLCATRQGDGESLMEKMNGNSRMSSGRDCLRYQPRVGKAVVSFLAPPNIWILLAFILRSPSPRRSEKLNANSQTYDFDDTRPTPPSIANMHDAS